MEIITAILEQDWPAVEKKIKLIDDFTEWIQLDVCDGMFAPNQTWDSPQDLFSLRSKVKLETHLMINEPWLKTESWLASPVRRIIVQAEAFSSPESVKFGEIVFAARKYGKEVAWGFGKEIGWEPYKELMQAPEARVLFLAVEAGRQGQEFDRGVMDKIRTLKSAHPHVKIAVDGGVNLSVARELKEAGADIIVVGSGILKSPDPKQVIEDLGKV